MLKPYSEYKDSGVERIGNYPKNWMLKRLKFVVETNPSKPSDFTEDLQCVFIPMEAMNTDGTFDQSERRPFSELKNGFTSFAKNDVIFAKITPCFENGKGALLSGLESEVGFGSTEFHVLRAMKERTISGFLYYLTISGEFRRIGEAFMQGVAGQKRVTNDFIRDYILAVPSIGEQKAIASYLDRKTVQIDALIAKKERMIEFLKEERSAVINQVVTRGLDPNVELKDSGIEWLGKVPKHWKTKKLKFLFKIVNGSTPKSGEPDYWDGDIYWATPDDFSNAGSDGVLSRTRRQITMAGYESCGTSLTPTKSIIVSTRAPIGYVAVLGRDMCCNQGCRILIRRTEISNERFYYYFLTAFSLVLASLGDGSTFKELSRDKLADFLFLDLPVPEQNSIVTFLDQKTAQFDGQIEREERSIELLKEFRTALISEVVTGKIDVRTCDEK